MRKFQNNAAVLSGRDAKKLIKLYNKMAKTLIEFETLWYQAHVLSFPASWGFPGERAPDSVSDSRQHVVDVGRSWTDVLRRTHVHSHPSRHIHDFTILCCNALHRLR